MEWFRAFNNAAGIRRYVIGGAITIALLLFDYIKPYLIGAGMTSLVGMPSWALAIIVALCFALYWTIRAPCLFRTTIRKAPNSI